MATIHLQRSKAQNLIITPKDVRWIMSRGLFASQIVSQLKKQLMHARTRCIRVVEPLDVSEYSVVNCLAHAFYVPLYLAGPTITFNAFVSQMRRPQTCYSASYMLAYGARLVVVFLLLELDLHWGPCFAIATSGSFVDMTPSQLGFLTFVTLFLMWLKFTFIWRFARWWFIYLYIFIYFYFYIFINL